MNFIATPRRRALIASAVGLAATLPAPAFAEPATPEGDATLTVTLLTAETGGAVMIAVFDSAEGYEANTPMRGVRAPVAADTQTVQIDGLAPGAYALRAFHDVNDDGELNRNPFGAPVEPYAFSNDAAPRFGPPAWDDAQMALASGDNEETLDFRP